MKKILTIASLAFAATHAFAAVSLITSRGSYTATDDLDFNGAELSSVASGHVYSTTGTPFNVKVSSDSSMMRYDQSSVWGGNFTPGDHLLSTYDLFTGGKGSYIEFTGTKTCIDVGAQVQTNQFGSFTAMVEAWDGLDNYLGSVTESGVSAPSGDGSAIFIGVHSSAGDIHKVRFSMLSNDGAGFAVNHLSYNCCAPVPEPASMSALGLGALALLRKKSKKA
ncbi:MAG: PEP-CTERM sorting domain-containing protein [Armatimonadetes bacterium]|nr:PEP-CTERM sorting domain-containing protein [Armatimonadota bacterium]